MKTNPLTQRRSPNQTDFDQSQASSSTTSPHQSIKPSNLNPVHAHRSPSISSNEVQPKHSTLDIALQLILSLVKLILGLISQPFILLPTSVIILFLAIVSWAPTAFNYFLSTISHQILQLFTFSAPSITPLTYLYCTILSGPFFCKQEYEKSIPVSRITRSVSTSAKLASDIFDSVIGLGDPLNLGLHQSEILELALAIQYSTTLDGKDALANQLWELSDVTRDVKDQVISLNSQGINTFSFIAYEVSELKSYSSQSFLMLITNDINLVKRSSFQEFKISLNSFILDRANTQLEPYHITLTFSSIISHVNSVDS